MQSQVKKDYFWNTMGSGITAVFSVVVLWAVTRIMGPYVGGVFAFGYAVSQQLQTVGAYEIRTYQATDVREVFKFETYLAARIITCLAMILCAVAYGFYHEGFTEEAIVLILICMLKVFDAFEDVFHGMFQQHKKLYIAGKALFYRMLITMLGFVLFLYITRSLLISCILTILISAVAVFYLNVPEAKKMVSIRIRFQWNQIKGLLISCFPLFVGAFVLQYLSNLPKYGMDQYMSKEYQTYYSILFMPAFVINLFSFPLFVGAFVLQYLSNLPKYGMDQYMSKEYQTYYSILFMPAFVINLFSGFAFKPLLTSLAENWVGNQKSKFMGTIVKGLLIVGGLTVVVIGGGYLLGIPVLSWIYGVELAPYKTEFILLLLGGGFSAAGVILYYGLMVMRCQKLILYGYILTLLISLPFSGMMTQQWGMLGASLLYVGLMLLRCIILVFSIWWGMRSSRKKEKGDLSHEVF